MHLIYMLTNTAKTDGKRFYIGSKQESQICEVDGVDRIIDRNGVVYNSSSQSIEFKDDLSNGNIFEASMLEEVKERKKLIHREEYWINSYNAVNSYEFYNISNAMLDCHNQDAILNEFGEIFKVVSSGKSAVSKKDNTAKKYGFNNFGEFSFKLHELLKINNGQEVANIFPNMGRHVPKRFIEKYDMDKAEIELKNNLTKQVRMMYVRGATLQYISHHYNIELPTARIFLGDYSGHNMKRFLTSYNIGMSKTELEVAVTKEFLSGKGLNEIARLFKIEVNSCKRYLYKCVREKLKISDL